MKPEREQNPADPQKLRFDVKRIPSNVTPLIKNHETYKLLLWNRQKIDGVKIAAIMKEFNAYAFMEHFMEIITDGNRKQGALINERYQKAIGELEKLMKDPHILNSNKKVIEEDIQHFKGRITKGWTGDLIEKRDIRNRCGVVINRPQMTLKQPLQMQAILIYRYLYNLAKDTNISKTALYALIAHLFSMIYQQPYNKDVIKKMCWDEKRLSAPAKYYLDAIFHKLI